MVTPVEGCQRLDARSFIYFGLKTKDIYFFIENIVVIGCATDYRERLRVSMQKEDREEILPPLTEDEKMWSGLCYPFWFVFSPWTLKTDKKKELFVYFHALQGLYYGIFTGIVTFVFFIFIFISFFLPQIQIPKDPYEDVSMFRVMGCGTLAVIFSIFFIFFILVVVFLTLYFGWKAASGKIFKIPFIGTRAWDIVYAEKQRLEEIYAKSIESAPAAEAQSETTQHYDLDGGTVLPDETVEKIRSIFLKEDVTKTDNKEEVQEEIQLVEEVKQQETSDVEKQSISPLDKLRQLRKTQYSQPEPVKFGEFSHAAAEVDTLQQELSILEEKPAEKMSKPLSPKPLSPLNQLAAMRKKKDSDSPLLSDINSSTVKGKSDRVIHEISRNTEKAETIESFRPKKADITSSKTVVGRKLKVDEAVDKENGFSKGLKHENITGSKERIKKLMQKPAVKPSQQEFSPESAAFLSPLEQLALRHKQKTDIDDNGIEKKSPEEKAAKMISFFDKMDNWSRSYLGGAKEDEEDEIF